MYVTRPCKQSPLSVTYYLLPVTYFGVIFNITIVIIRKMMFGNHVPSTGGRPPETEKTVEICCRKMNEKASPMPMKTWTPTPRVDFRQDTLTPNRVMMMMPTGLAKRLCCSIW